MADTYSLWKPSSVWRGRKGGGRGREGKREGGREGGKEGVKEGGREGKEGGRIQPIAMMSIYKTHFN